MDTIQLARRLAELGQTEDAQKAYFLVLQENMEKEPLLEFEAANYIFFSKGNYKVAFTAFVSLYNRGFFQERILEIMIQAFYLPNIKKQQTQYKKNVEKLQKYPYLFCKNFLSFEDLPILFIPFDKSGYVPFYKDENRFGEYIDFNNAVIDRYFFKDLENPILAEDVYSQYQLEYLNDNVRESKWIGRENHIYLHYTNWNKFCCYLACLDFSKILRDEKIVFLIEEEISQYPIDFKERFGIDYSQYEVKPFGIREINRLIWHTQLSTHNGGDFFNEVFHQHPNLYLFESIWFYRIVDEATSVYNNLKNRKKGTMFTNKTMRELASLPNPTLKDCFVAIMMDKPEQTSMYLQADARIVPACFFQPHFPNIITTLCPNIELNCTTLASNEYLKIRAVPIFEGFKYIKTFTPMRRITTSYSASIRFMVNNSKNSNDEDEKKSHMPDIFVNRLLNRSFMVNSFDRLYHDSVLVRFEDAKLNPKATFTALAEFLDIPYTESMTYCSGLSGLNPESMKGNVLGFDTASVYKTYDEYANDADRALLEYFLRDVYEFYGYDFHYYKGETVDWTWIEEKLNGITTLDNLIISSCEDLVKNHFLKEENDLEKIEKIAKENGETIIKQYRDHRRHVIGILMKGLNFVNEQGQPLHMMPMLKLDPALLEQPLYH